MELTGKVALITGAAQGIGKAVTLALARHGADVVVADVNIEKAQETAREVEALDRAAMAVRVDVTRLEDVEKHGTVGQDLRLHQSAGVQQPFMQDPVAFPMRNLECRR